ncbi:MAG TPA: tetratricopeptide repeat protein [Saprospiraceae bacterium]|nr:tetratricopeptide repeat protein [Saprospiraceae bacterium]
MQYATFLLLFLLMAPALRAERFEFTPDVRTAYEQATSLRFTEARATLARIKKQDPGNLVAYHIENYLDFLNLYLNQSPADYKRLKTNEEIRIAKIQRGDANSPYYLYAQADIRLQWALVKLRFGDYLAGFNDVSKAHKLLKKNQEKFPDFLPNRKDLGVLYALAGTVPDNYKWGVKLLSGLNGSVEQGRRELAAVFQHAQQHEFIFKAETAVIYATVLLYLENKSEAAWRVLQQANLEPDKNPLHCYVMSDVAMRSGRNDQAIEQLLRRPRGKSFAEVPQFDFLLGLAKLRRLDADATEWFQRFLSRHRGNDGIKETYQKLAWHELVHGNMIGYQRYMQLVLEKGQATTGNDKDALQEARSVQPADVRLVKARLLFDGGYYRQAHQQLENQSAHDFEHEAARLEYFYRLGRILHGLERYDEALSYYDQTVQQGRNAQWFYACNAALQAGLICETRRDYARARTYFSLCLSMNPQEYKSELHQKAKSGLARLK